MPTKHALTTKAGIQAKKLEKLKAQLAVSPKSAGGESIKESIRMFVSLLVGTLIAYLYSKYPILGELQPDQTVWIVVLTSLIVRFIDKYVYQAKKNKGQVSRGVGIDWVFVSFANLFSRQKTSVVQIEENKK